MSSSQLAIRVDNLGKRYQIGKRNAGGRAGRIRSHLSEFVPFLADTREDSFWALKDVNFEVKQGDILGILGRNGSGKSTLLKILAGVTHPTTGRAELRGRLGSLLEVGTGFHPDLTGRENIFMAGALLGLKQSEIRAKFDEIVDFSGIEKFIDMPVKRYSSGMYVRLAYSVASMLRSDILILDEVMAVGDAAFLEKSQKNIEGMAKEGRTILFVSHDARAIKSICRSGMILQNGQCTFQGSADAAITAYMRDLHHFANDEGSFERTRFELEDAARMTDVERVLRWVSLHKEDGTSASHFFTGEPLLLRIGYDGATARQPFFAVYLMNEFAERVATIHSTHQAGSGQFPPKGVIECRIENLAIGTGDYWIMIEYGNYGGTVIPTVALDCVPNAARCSVDVNGWVRGIGLTAFQGAAMKSVWEVVE
jgi:lipopolysaccharide transport system ATP-binding protein